MLYNPICVYSPRPAAAQGGFYWLSRDRRGRRFGAGLGTREGAMTARQFQKQVRMPNAGYVAGSQVDRVT
jgi:hypothetical protein